MSVTCLIDQTEHESIEALHRYIRPKMKQETYYTQYVNKRDLATGEPIVFKNADQYLAQDFLHKDHIREFIKRDPVRGREWAINWLKKRKEEKGLVYAPSQAELMSLDCPSMHYYDSIGGYYKLTRDLGFKDRYLPFHDYIPAKAVKTDDICIICDTREQKPLQFTAKTVRSALNVGDYGLAPPHDQGIYIERKAIGDFYGTLNQRSIERVKKQDDSAYARFDRELERAASKGHYIVMVVESSIQDALVFDENEHRRSRVSAAHVFFNLRTLLTKYPLNFQAIFVDGREEAARVMIKVFEMGAAVKTYDLEYSYERGIL